MTKIVYRRYQKVLVEQKAMPDLILVDGGKGQINATKEILDQLNIDVKLAGLKKNKKHQLDALVYQNQIYPLLKNSELYQLLLKISEEVHRFAIAFHRKTRDKTANQSFLDDIKGIGPKRKLKLLTQFKSIEDIQNAPTQTLKDLGIPNEVITQLKEVIK